VEYVVFEGAKLVFYLAFERDLCRVCQVGNELSRRVDIHLYYLRSGNICLTGSRVGLRIFCGDGERGIVFVELATDFLGDGNHHDFEIYFVVEDCTVEDRIYYLFFDLMTDFDFVVDTDDHLFLVIDLSVVKGLSDESGLPSEDENDLWNAIDLLDRIEVQDFVYGIWYLILTFVDLV